MNDYIRKRRTPSEVKKRADEIKNASENRYMDIKLPEDSGKLRNLFEEMPKDEKPHILCCDAARGDENLTINPWNERQMEAIAYYRNGEIFIRQDKGLDLELVKKMQNDIDEILVLNGKKDLNGQRIYDTASKLVASRRSICDSVHSQFERWDKKKCLTEEFLREKISKLEAMLDQDNIAGESYIGVRLYLYKRKLEKLKRRCLS